jgi:hypothetical protein
MYRPKENGKRDIQGHKRNTSEKSMRPKPIKTNKFQDQNNFSRGTWSVTGSWYKRKTMLKF